MSTNSPNPRYFKDAHGFKPTWRFALWHPRKYIWLRQPKRVLVWRLRRKWPDPVPEVPVERKPT